jgi:co-chaperonin GroES (HSP10)
MKDYGIRPVGDRILVLRDKAAEKIGSIVLAVSAQEPPLEGTVVALGTAGGFYVKPGDKVLFASYSGVKLPEGTAETELLVMRELELLCVREWASEARNGAVAVKATLAPAR